MKSEEGGRYIRQQEIVKEVKCVGRITSSEGKVVLGFNGLG